MIVDEYLNTISGKVNAPTFAYLTLYGRMPNPPISGREISHKTKKINGIDIDIHIPTDVIKSLNRISDIETRSSCEGQDDRHPTFLIFRLMNRDEKVSKIFVQKMKKMKKISCAYDIGQGGLPRICITWSTWYGNDGFEDWWKKLPFKITKCL